MRLSYFPKSAARNSAPVITALMQGFQLHGVQPDLENHNSDMVVLWSQLWAGRMRPNQAIYQHYVSRGLPVLIVDVGSIQRNHTWRITLSGNAYVAGRGYNSDRRHELGLELQPWQNCRGDNIVIALQRPDSNQWQGQPDMQTWCDNMIAKIRTHSQRPIEIRPHPRSAFQLRHRDATLVTPCRVAGTYDDVDFPAVFRRSWAVVNWNSTPGILAVRTGIPAFVGASSLAAPVANLDLARIENPEMPDREQWANDLAWTEWTVQEIAQGLPQSYILHEIKNRGMI